MRAEGYGIGCSGRCSAPASAAAGSCSSQHVAAPGGIGSVVSSMGSGLRITGPEDAADKPQGASAAPPTPTTKPVYIYEAGTSLMLLDTVMRADGRPWHYRWRTLVWWTFEEPSSSMIGNLISTLILTVIVISIFNFAVGSFDDGFCTWYQPYSPGVSERRCTGVRLEEREVSKQIEAACIFIFTGEYLIRLLCSSTVTTPGRFVVAPLNILDLVAILPWYITAIVALFASNESSISKILGIVRIVRLTRILRVFKASKSMKLMLVLGRTLKRSTTALLVLLFATFGMVRA